MTPYHQFVAGIAQLVQEGKQFPLGSFPIPARAAPSAEAPRVLVFSPHPDDECIIGGLALRLQREAGLRVVNVAVTQGSNKSRQAARLEELRRACEYLGFDLVETIPGGLEKINLATRSSDAAHWRAAVDVMARIIDEHKPSLMCFPHDADWNSSHIGTHHVVVDALRQLPGLDALVAETEFWGAMATPNVTVELSPHDVGDLMAALSFHIGEVQRNPYHLLVPAWMQDNVRRGGELVGGQGGAAPDFTFATLYRLRRWSGGDFTPILSGGRHLPAGVSAAELLGW